MAYNYGLEIRKILRKRGMTVTEFARRINKSRENAYDIFTRKSLDIELLKTISQVLEHDFIGGKNPGSLKHLAKDDIAHENTAGYSKMQHELGMLREEIHLLRKEMGDLRDRVNKVEKRKRIS